MQSLFNLLTQLSFSHTLWAFYAIFVLHELEEWNINDFEHRNFNGTPAASTHRSARTWIGFIVLVGLVWIGGGAATGVETLAACITLPAITLAMSNAIQHVFWTLYFRQYAPGVISALLLLLPLGSYIYTYSLQQGLVSSWYALVCSLVGLFMVMQTIRAGREMVPAVKAINELGIRLSQKLS